MRLQVIGESVNKLPKELKNKYNKIDWIDFVRLRNVVSHAYFSISPEMIMSIVEKKIPLLKSVAVSIKKDLF